MNYFSKKYIKLYVLLCCCAIFALRCEISKPNSSSQPNGEDTPLSSTCKVSCAENSASNQFQKKIIPQNEPFFHKQWHLCNPNGIDINIMPVWEKGYGTKPISVGILDTGVDIQHPDLIGNSIIVDGFREYNPNSNHGTNVAGVIAARDNGIGIIGIAPRANIYSYDIAEPNNFTAHIIKALQRSDEYKTIAVYNGSIGTAELTGSYRELPEQLKNAMDTVTKNGFYDKGSNLVFAAGNDPVFGNTANDLFQRHYAVITINSIRKTGKIESFIPQSTYIPRNFARGVTLWITAPRTIITTKNGDGYNESFRGTSSAAPVVSGAIALLRSEYPDFTWRDVKLILAESAKKHDDNGKAQYEKSGMKHSDGSEQHHSRRMGFGLLDVASMFDLAENWKLLPTMEKHTTSQSTILSVTKNTKHTSTLIVQNSGIEFIESVTLEMNIKKTKKQIDLKTWSLRLIGPEAQASSIYNKLNDEFMDTATILKNTNTLTFVVNSFLGSSADGQWMLEIQQNQNDIINEITDWKLIFRGY